MRVLLVDDDAEIRALARALAEHAGCSEVIDVADGHDAVRAVSERPFDLAVVDFHMQGMNGLETTRRLLAAQPELSVVAWTSVLDPAVETAFLDAGAVRHIAKTDTAELAAQLERSRSQHEQAAA